jgi:hypothetical protein
VLLSCEGCARVLEHADRAARDSGAESYAVRCPLCGEWLTRSEGEP